MEAVREPDIGDFLRDIWRAKWFLTAGALTGLMAAALFLAFSVPQYRAEMLTGPAERGTGPDIKALLPDNSSFAVQYLVNSLGSQDSGDYMRFEHILRAPRVAAHLMKDERIMQAIQADRRFSFERRDPVETAADLSLYLEENVHIEPVGTTPLRRIVYLHPDPGFAVYLLGRLHIIADDLIRRDIREKAARREAYLQETIKTVSHPDHRRALTALLMEQEHVRMILAIDEPFAATVAEPAAAQPKAAWPRKPLVFAVSVFVSMFLSFLIYAGRRPLPGS